MLFLLLFKLNLCFIQKNDAFLKYVYVLSGEIQRRALPWYQSYDMKMLINNNSFPRIGIELKTNACATAPRWPHSYSNHII